MVNSQKVLTVSYASADTSTTGLGLRIHFDSSAVTLSDITNVFTTDAITLPAVDAVETDSEDADNNPETDSFVLANWASLFGTWPGSSPVNLATFTFDIVTQ
jgi:hypothetical protein